MILFEEILPKKDIKKLLYDKRSGINVKGKFTSTAPENVIQLMNSWCKRVDNLIELDKDANGEHTDRSDNLIRWRGFTYHA